MKNIAVNNGSTSRYYPIMRDLIYADLLVFKQSLLDKFIDIGIWIALTNFVYGYILPYFGLQNTFGVFQFAGALASIGLFELYASSVDFVADIEGERVINYRLTLPIPSWLALVSKAIYYTIVYAVLTFFMFPLGKLLLWNQFDLGAVAYGKLVLIVIAQSIFCAAFSMWAVTIIESMQKLGTIWCRLIFPMWFMGGFSFSWIALHQAVPVVAWINLVNPMIYITEGTRAALIGQEGYLNFWLSFGMILLFAGFFLYIGIKGLQKRLDCV